jgi:RNA polymerase sigma factor (sigma-70 family)
MSSQKGQGEKHSFVQYERLLWVALGRLAAAGYVAPPSEARDLIHDFYVEQWRGLTSRYDPGRGTFSGYLFAAFYRFARRRILQLQNWRRRLVDAAEAAHQADDSSSPLETLERKDEAEERDRRLFAVREALDALPRLQLEVLRDFLSSSGTQRSERGLAGRHGLSRYRLREVLVEALGRVVTELQHRWGADVPELQAAAALWQDGRTVRDAARVLGLSIEEVRTARRQYVARLLKAIRSIEKPTSEERNVVSMDHEQLTVLKKALLSPRDQALLKTVRRDADKIREALEEADLEFSEAEVAQLERNPEWTAAVYRELAGPAELSEREEEIAAAIAGLRQDEDREIAAAFVSLVETLPERFRAWEKWFADVPPAPEPFQAHLRKQIVVIESRPHSGWLTAHGMTPATFLEAARVVELLLDRLLRTAREEGEGTLRQTELRRFLDGVRHRQAEGVPACADVVLNPEECEAALYPVPFGLLLAQIRGTPQCPPEAAEPLLRWMVGVAQLKPFFFRGYQASTLGKGAIRLTREAVVQDADLMLRWGRHTQEVEQKELVSC